MKIFQYSGLDYLREYQVMESTRGVLDETAKPQIELFTVN